MPPKPKPTVRGMGRDSRNLSAILSGFQQGELLLDFYVRDTTNPNTDPNNSEFIKLKEMSTTVIEKVRATSRSVPVAQRILIEYSQVTRSYTYDYASTSTQNRRKLHLDEFTNIIKSTVKITETNGAEHEDWEKRLWGEWTWFTHIRSRSKSPDFLAGNEFIEDNIRAYVLMISQLIQPRSFTSKSISFSTLAARRQSMVYWVIQKCDQKVVSIRGMCLSFA